MYGKLPERRQGQKLCRPSTFRVENEHDTEEMPQYFQISVNVMEAKKLVWSNPHTANSYVVVILGKKKYRSNMRRNMEEPFYNECFVYEMYTTIQELQQSSIWLAVMEPRSCAPSKLLGEATIDLGAVWAQPHHQVFHKWAQLILPRNPSVGPVGFLKVDVSILFRGEVLVMPAIVNQDPTEDNLLLPTGSEQQRANYLVTIHAAFGIPSGNQNQGDKRYGKPPNTFVKVSFCGLAVKTGIQQRTYNPMYSEQISIVEMFPNLCQMISFEVCSTDGYFNKVLASTQLKLGLISHDGDNGFLPTFGPCLLHMYGTSNVGPTTATCEEGPFHRGALLVSLKTIVPYYQQGLRTTSVEPVAPIKTEHLWALEDFCVLCPILEVSMLDKKITGKACGVALTIGEMCSDCKTDEDFCNMMTEIKARKLHYTGSLEVIKSKTTGHLDFSNGYPVLQLATRLPDFRFRMYRNNMIEEIANEMETSLLEVERRLEKPDKSYPTELIDELNKIMDDAACNIAKFLDVVQYSGPNANSVEDLYRQYSTELDHKQIVLQREEMDRIYQQILKRTSGSSTQRLIRSVTKNSNGSIDSKKSVKFLISDIKIIAQNIKNLICKMSEGWPDIVLWLLNGGSRVAFHRIPAASVIHSSLAEQCGRNCGRIQTVYLKPLKCLKHNSTLASNCYCIAGKVELSVWMGLYRQTSNFESRLPAGMKLRNKGHVMVLKAKVVMLECRAFVYRAKLTNIADQSTIATIFVRVNGLNSVKETKEKPKTATPVWNQVLRLQRMVFATTDRLLSSPPVITVEVFENDLVDKTTLVGRFEVQPVIDDHDDFEYAPKLQWFDLFKGTEYTGQILMSVQLLQVPEQLMKTTVYSPVEETVFEAENKQYDISTDDVEPLPLHLIPKAITYKVDVYWWGLRDVNITRKPCVILEIDDLTIKSDIISEKKVNCNFPNGRASHIFEAPLNETYSSPLTIRLYDSGTFGRTLYLGTNIVKNPNKYLVNWIAKQEREQCLKSASITSSEYFQVNHMTFVKKSNDSVNDDTDEYISDLSNKSSIGEFKTKRSKWNKLFSLKEPSEEEYALLPVLTKENNQIKMIKKNIKPPDQRDWWLRYFSAQKDYANDDNTSVLDNIKIYESELEAQPEYSKFKDWCSSLKFYNGKKTGIPEKDEQLYCGSLKAGLAIYRWPPPGDTVAVSCSGVDLRNGYFEDYPINDPVQFLVRVYLVKGIELRKEYCTGKSNPYVIINCGKKKLGSRNNYVQNTANPIFGKMYEFRSNLPDDYLLTVMLYDYDAAQSDEFIGSTDIDLEDRVYTRHRARLGLASEYNLSGPYKWRDSAKPSEILEDLCMKCHLPLPMYPDFAGVIVNGVEYRDNDKDKPYLTAIERRENICLSIIRKWHTMPLCGYYLVPEHVETRLLVNQEKPGLEQGKIQMWVDLFPMEKDVYVPPPIDITPRKPEDFELRVTIWDVQKLQVENKTTPDVYVKVWVGSPTQAQTTDIHPQCEGSAQFNWRLIFEFQYQYVEWKIIVKVKGPFTEYEERVPPMLVVQVMDTEAISVDDNIGTLNLFFNSFSRGEKCAELCTLESFENAKKVNLFGIKTMRGWWPIWSNDEITEKKKQVGIIDMELMLLPKKKALLMPVGNGRKRPNPLPKPCRPKRSMCKKKESVMCSGSSVDWNGTRSRNNTTNRTANRNCGETQSFNGYYKLFATFCILLLLFILTLIAVYFQILPDANTSDLFSHKPLSLGHSARVLKAAIYPVE